MILLNFAQPLPVICNVLILIFVLLLLGVLIVGPSFNVAFLIPVLISLLVSLTVRALVFVGVIIVVGMTESYLAIALALFKPFVIPFAVSLVSGPFFVFPLLIVHSFAIRSSQKSACSIL